MGPYHTYGDAHDLVRHIHHRFGRNLVQHAQD